MKRVLLAWLCISLATKPLFAQQGNYDIAVSYGFYKAPSYKQVVNKTFLAADFDYHISKRWTISSGFVGGQFAYFEDWRSNAFTYESATNAKGYESHLYLTLLYSILQSNKLSIQVGSGAGLFTQRLKYPYAAPSSGGAPSQYGGQVFTAEESFSLFELPLRIDGFYMLNRRVGAGLKAGAFLQLNRPVSGIYLGPQLRVRL